MIKLFTTNKNYLSTSINESKYCYLVFDVDSKYDVHFLHSNKRTKTRIPEPIFIRNTKSIL